MSECIPSGSTENRLISSRNRSTPWLGGIYIYIILVQRAQCKRLFCMSLLLTKRSIRRSILKSVGDSLTNLCKNLGVDHCAQSGYTPIVLASSTKHILQSKHSTIPIDDINFETCFTTLHSLSANTFSPQMISTVSFAFPSR